MSHYILDAKHRPVKVPLLEWARWFEDADNRRIADDVTKLHRISTVFLGIDYRWGDGPPLLFETMVFMRKAVIKEICGKLRRLHESVETQRYVSWDDAMTGHKTALRRYQRADKHVQADGSAE